MPAHPRRNEAPPSKLMSLKMYVLSFLLRMGTALLSAAFAIAGIGLAATNQVSSDTSESRLILAYFTVIAAVELGTAFFFGVLYSKQPSRADLTGLNRWDCTFSCLTLMVRVGWTLGLGATNQVFLYRADLQLQADKASGSSYRQGVVDSLYVVTALVMAAALFNVIGFIVGVFNQPLSYVRVNLAAFQHIQQDLPFPVGHER